MGEEAGQPHQVGKGSWWSPAACRDQAAEAWMSSGAALLYIVGLEHQRVLCTDLKNKRAEQLCALREEETSFLQPTGMGFKRHLNRVSEFWHQFNSWGLNTENVFCNRSG